MAVLNEKEIPHEVKYIDLSNKPDWFLEISPTGKVPVLRVDDENVLFESAVINEYLDEAHPPQLMASTPLGRAYERMWSDFVTGLYGGVYRLYNAKKQGTADEAISSLRERMGRIEEEVQGPLFAGEQFGLVDATAAPPFTRLDWCQCIDPSLDFFADLPKMRAWKDALLARPGIQNSYPANLYEIFADRIQKSDG